MAHEGGPELCDPFHWRKHKDNTTVGIQRRCQSAAALLEAAGSRAWAGGEVAVSGDLLLEAASLLKGYDQCLLIEQVLGTPESARATKAIISSLPTEPIMDPHTDFDKHDHESRCNGRYPVRRRMCA